MSGAEARLGRCALEVLQGAVLLALASFSAVNAQDAELPTLELEVPADLHVGEHARVLLSARLPTGAAKPLLVTPFREGSALEIVKGRLLRSDAADATANPLRFELPVVALAPGAAVIGVRVLAYVCRDTCRAVEVETRANVVVLPR
jgi:hypothetical protein